MFNADDIEKRPRSLLQLGEEAPAVRPSREATPALRDEAPPDPVALHRLARSRREAAPNPLLAALAQDDTPAAATAPASRAMPDAEPRSSKEADNRPGIGERISGSFSGLFGTRKPDPVADAGSKPETPAPSATASASRGPYGRRQDDVAPAYVAAVEAARSAAAAQPAPSAPQPTAAAVAAPPPPAREAAPPRQDAGDQTWRPLIEPTSVISGIGRSKALIFATTMLGAFIGVAIALSTPKKYEAAAELLIDPRDLQLLDRNLTEGGLPSDATLAIVENQVRVITSGTVLNKVVDTLKLQEDPEFNGQRASFGIRSAIAWLRSLMSSAGGRSGEGRRHALAVESLAESLTVERGGKTFVVVIAAKTEDAEKSALIANTVTDVFLDTYGLLQSRTAQRATAELSGQLSELRTAVETAERNVESFKAQNDLIDASGRLISDDEIIKLNEQLAIARVKTMELNAKAASTRSINVDSVIVGTLPEEISSNGMVELRSQYASLKREADRLAVKLGPRHPELLAMQSEVAGLRGEINNELRRIVSSVQTEMRRAVQLEQDLAARLAQLKVRQGGVSDDLVTLRELEREAAAKRAVYEAFLLRSRETGEQQNINTANMSVISEAFPPLDPTGPSRALVSLTGMVLGFAAGLLLGGLRGALASLRSTVAARGPRPQGAAAVEEDDAPLAGRPKPQPLKSGAKTENSGTPRTMLSFLDRKSRRDRKAAEAMEPPPARQEAAAAASPAMAPAHMQAPVQMQPQPVPPAAPPAYAYPQQMAMHPQMFYPAQPHAPYPVYAGMPPVAPAMYPAHAFQPPAPMPVYPQAYAPQPAYPQFVAAPPPPMMWQAPVAQTPVAQPAPQMAEAPRRAEPQRRDWRDEEEAAFDRSVRADLDDVRHRLREFREAIADLSEERQRRRAY
jgi:succinoglycan biosynthesis transport protein ExoP